MVMAADERKPDRQDQQQQEQEEENDEEQRQKEQDKEESPQSPPSKVARVASDESSAAAGAVTTAVASPLVLGLGLGAAAEEGKPPGFTFMQMQEFHHQALIFKHMVAGIPVPIYLILPIWKSVAASYGPHHYPSFVGLGNLCSDFRNSMEPEPGRCRRTDGKKWRCSRDVVPGQKYCERHMHRGRNRSRKPVEAAAVGTSVAPSSTTTTTNLSMTIADDDGPTNNNNNNNSSSSSNFNINSSSSSNDVSTARIVGFSPTSVLGSSTACKTATS